MLAAFAPPAVPVSVMYPARLGAPNVTAFVQAIRAHCATLPMLAPAAR